MSPSLPPSALVERRPRLARKLGALSEQRQVMAVLYELWRDHGADELLVVLDASLEDVQQHRSTMATVVLLAAMQILDEQDSDRAARELRLRARELGMDDVARFVDSPPPLLLEQARRAQVMRAHDGRPLTLGERKSLARNPTRLQIDRLLADPSQDVVRNLLLSPKLTELDVVRLVSRRPGVPEVLAEVARSRRWVMRYRVRLALVRNPALDPALSVKLAVHLLEQDRRDIARDHTLHPRLREACAPPETDSGVKQAPKGHFDPDLH